MSLHKAEPVAPNFDGEQPCKGCGEKVKKVPGGNGPTWVHVATGTVVGGGGFTLVFASCDGHTFDALSALDSGKDVKVKHLAEPHNSMHCIDGHAPATWLFYQQDA